MATIGELLTELRGIVDEREELSARDSVLSSRKAEIENELRHKAAEQGVSKFDNDLIGVSFSSDMRFKYDPAKWPDVVKWAVETDNLQIIQRRMTDAQIKSLLVEGVALPDGLTPDPYVKISVRRK